MPKQPVFRVASIGILLATIYWGFVASDRYVSEAQVVIEKTDLSGGGNVDLTAFIAGSSGINHGDQLLLRAHLLSVDMSAKLDARLKLREHYSDRSRDVLSRMWSVDSEQEWFHKHYLGRTSVEFDEYAGLLVIKAQAYDAKMAQAIASALVEEGEAYMNELAHRLARDQVNFLERQVDENAKRVMKTRQELVAYQNQQGMLSPEAMAETLLASIGRLESQATELKTKRSAYLGYLSPTAPAIVELGLQLQAVEKQIAVEQSRLTSSKGRTLNRTVEEYQRLEIAAKFAQDVYKTALVGLEKGRVEVARNLKKVSVLQTPTLPQYPLEPRRFYNIVVFALAALIVAGMLHMLTIIIRDHQD